MSPGGKSIDLRHREKRYECHKDAQSQAGLTVVPDVRFKLTRARSCTTGTWLGHNRDRSRADLRSCDLLVSTSGPSRTEQANFEVVTCGFMAGATGPSGILSPGIVSSHLGMGHPGAAGSGEVKTWRGGAVVEAGAEAILMNWVESSLFIYPLELEE